MKHLLLILAVSVLFRFLYLGVIPVSLSHDETDSIIQAHSVIQTGTDIAGTWSPLSFLPNSGVMAELAPLIHAPALTLLPNSLFTAHLTDALLGSFFPLLIFYWLTLLKTKRNVALTAAALLSISPWHIIFSRTALEASASLFFYLCSWVFLTKLTADKNAKNPVLNLVLFIIFYILGFFTYHGSKFSMPLLTGLIILWRYFTATGKQVKKLLVISLIVVLLLLIRTVVFSNKYASRNSELLLFNTDKYEESINLDRRQSLAPPGLRQLYSNKPIKLIQELRDKYLAAVDLDLLFLHGETNGAFSLWKVGYLYLIFLPFLLIGLAKMITSHKPEQLLLLVLLVLSPIASVLHVNNSLAFRSGIYFVLLNIVTAYGIVSTSQFLSTLNPKVRGVLYTLFSIVLAISISYFSYTYFYISPVTNANSYFYSDRLIANYIRLAPNNKTLIITTQPRYLKSAVILANSNVTKEDILSFNSSYSPVEADEYLSDSLTIVRSCPMDVSREYDTVILETNAFDKLKDCAPVSKLLQNEQNNLVYLVAIQDSGEQYKIIGDNLCKDYSLMKYVHPTSLSDYKLERMNAAQFCQTWVVRR